MDTNSIAKNNRERLAAFIFSFFCLYQLGYGQHAVIAPKPVAEQSPFQLMPFEQGTLGDSRSPLIMPYNRLIDPAGKTVYFGNPSFENHSLDAALLPDNQSVVVEDRYGITLFNINSHKVLARFAFNETQGYEDLMSTFSGIKSIRYHDSTYLFWSSAKRASRMSYVIQACWDGSRIKLMKTFPFIPLPPASTALPNELQVENEQGELYLYVVLNGNNLLLKIRVADQQISWSCATGVAPYGITIVKNIAYITNWGGPVPTDSIHFETAGVPWGSAYTDPATGATAKGTVSIIDLFTGQILKEIEVGLHPNAIIHSPDQKFVYAANGNSDYISVINTDIKEVTDSISVSLFDSSNNYIGSTPNALAIDEAGKTLYVANGMDNALAVIDMEQGLNRNDSVHYTVKGFIPTEAYPAGIVLYKQMLVVTNLEAIGARVNSPGISQQNNFSIIKARGNAFTSHRQLASVSFIPIPGQEQLSSYTEKVKTLNLVFREKLSRLLPRKNIAPIPMPERIGEPSVFKHVLYIIKENRTYDQVLGDMRQGRGDPSLCVFGDSVTPNQHQLAKEFSLLDNYYASGKSSAEGHQWTDASMVTDYIEKTVRAWFRSYPHAQYDALVYDKEGFIWNKALDQGRSVRIYGEACTTEIDRELSWSRIYQLYLQHQPLDCKNIATISRVRPILSQRYPGYDDPRINDQLRADAFIEELNDFDKMPGDQWPELMVMALPNDHTAGLSPGYPTPRAMVADNDLALGRIIEAVTKSRFWDSTVIFVTEDDSQNGWDHISAYRTTGFVISPYSRLKKTIHTQYNQTSVLRSIEQILGIPPMNGLDATALPMSDCFDTAVHSLSAYSSDRNYIALDEMNMPLSALKGRAHYFANLSVENHFNLIDQGDEDLFNKVIWFASKGNLPYPKKFSGKDE